MSEVEPELKNLDDGGKKRGRPKGSKNKSTSAKKLEFVVDEKPEDDIFGEMTPDQTVEHKRELFGVDTVMEDPAFKKKKEQLFKLYISDPKAVTTAIEKVTSGADVLSELNTLTYEQLLLIEKASRIESSKKIDDGMIASSCIQSAKTIDGILSLEGKLERNISESKAVPELTRDVITDSFILSLPAIAKLGIVVGSHIFNAYREVQAEKVKHLPKQTE